MYAEMTASQTRQDHWWYGKTRGEKLLDIGVGIFWALHAGAYLASLVRSRHVGDLGLFLFYTLVAYFFIRRRPARRKPPVWQTAVAVGAVFWPMVGLRAAPRGLWVGEVIQAVALFLMVVAAASLGPSFGIAPADRGLRTQGLYRWIRHPLYASELLFYLGYALANWSWWNVMGVLVALGLTVLRIRWEERIIAGYDAYARRVRWRLLPYVW